MTRVRTFGEETFRSLRHRNFRLFFQGQTISQTGTWMQMVAIGLLVLDITDSGVAVGLALAAQCLPMLVLGAWAGLLADRQDRHRLLMSLNVAGAVVGGVFALVVLTDNHPLWLVYALATASGTVTALENPTPDRAFVTDLVPDADVPNAVGLNSTLMTGSRVIGPAVAGLLISGPGIGWCFAVNALSYLPQLYLFARMDRARFRPAARVEKAKGQVVEGLRYVWRTPQLRTPLLLVTVVGTLAFNFSVVLPLFAERDLDGGASTFTTLFSIMSVGSVVGALTVARRTTLDTRFVARGTLGLGLSMFALAAAPNQLLAYLLVLPVGITSVLVISGCNASIQLNAAPAMRGRVLALLAVVFLGSTPIGGPITGAISEVFGARWALAMGASASVVASLLTLRVLGPSPRRRAEVPATIEPAVVVAPGR